MSEMGRFMGCRRGLYLGHLSKNPEFFFKRFFYIKVANVTSFESTV